MNRKLLLILFLWLAPFHTFATESFGRKASVVEFVRSHYSITNDQLIAHDGKVFDKIPFKSETHEKLAYKLKDPALTDFIYSLFETQILPTLKDDQPETFGRALVNVCQLLGSTPERSDFALSKALVEEGFPYETWKREHSQAYERFIKELIIPAVRPEIKPDAPLKIVLISTSTSGGNLSVAHAVKSYLDLFPESYQTVYLDYETFAGQYDPIKIASGKFTVDNIFVLLQQHNVIEQELIEKDRLCREAAKYIPNRTAEKMKEAIKDIAPHLIITTRNYYADDFNLVSLGIPFRLLNCDYELCFFHHDYLGKADPELIRLWLPSDSPRFFKPFFAQHQQFEQYHRGDNWETLIGKLAGMTRSDPSTLQGMLEVFGFPVRLEFEYVEDEQALASFQSKWDLKPEEKGVIVDMGANGVGILENIFQTLKQAPAHSTPIKILFCVRKKYHPEGPPRERT